MKIGSIIKEIRNQKGITQERLAKKSKMSQTYLSQIESDNKEPTISTLEAIAKGLEIPLPFLFFMAMEPKDIKPDKRAAFEEIQPMVQSFIQQILTSSK